MKYGDGFKRLSRMGLIGVVGEYETEKAGARDAGKSLGRAAATSLPNMNDCRARRPSHPQTYVCSYGGGFAFDA